MSWRLALSPLPVLPVLSRTLRVSWPPPPPTTTIRSTAAEYALLSLCGLAPDTPPAAYQMWPEICISNAVATSNRILFLSLLFSCSPFPSLLLLLLSSLHFLQLIYSLLCSPLCYVLALYPFVYSSSEFSFRLISSPLLNFNQFSSTAYSLLPVDKNYLIFCKIFL